MCHTFTTLVLIKEAINILAVKARALKQSLQTITAKLTKTQSKVKFAVQKTTLLKLFYYLKKCTAAEFPFCIHPCPNIGGKNKLSHRAIL